MRSTKSYFNSTIFFKTMRRCWPLWGTYLAIFTLVFSVAASGNASTFRRYGSWSETGFYTISLTFGLFAIFIACILTAMFVYSWMYNARNASAYSALPIKRTGLFISTALAGAAPLIASNLIALTIAWIIGLAGGLNIFVTLLKCFAMLSFMCLLFYGIASFCAALTGHIFILPAIYIIFNFIAVVVELIVYFIMETFVYGATVGEPALMPLSPPVMLIRQLDIANSAGTIAKLAIYAAVGIILTVLATLIVRRRKMETSSDVVAIRILKPVFKYCMCFGCALTIGLLLFVLIFNLNSYDKYIAVALGSMMIIGGFIGYFTAEMLMKKSFRVFNKRTWKGFVAAAVVVIAFIAALEFDIFGYEKRIPDLDRVEMASISVGGEYTRFTSSADIAEVEEIHRLIIQNKVYNENRINQRYNTGNISAVVSYEVDTEPEFNAYPRIVHIDYELKNGRSVSRQYELILVNDPISDKLLALLNKPSSIRSRLNVDLDRLEIAEVYGTIPADYDFSDLSVGSDIEESSPYADTEAVRRIDYSFYGSDATRLYTEGVLADIEEGNIGIISFYGETYGSTRRDSFYLHICFETRAEEFDERESYTYHYYDNLYVYPCEESVNTLHVLKELCEKFENQAAYETALDKKAIT